MLCVFHLAIICVKKKHFLHNREQITWKVVLERPQNRFLNFLSWSVVVNYITKPRACSNGGMTSFMHVYICLESEVAPLHKL